MSKLLAQSSACPVSVSVPRLAVRSVLPALAIAMLAGCSMTPDYVRPVAPVAASYPDAASASRQAAVAQDIGWRTFFSDARLQALIEAALANNRDLRIAALRIEEARAQYDIQSAILPNINGVASSSSSRTPASLAAGGGNVDRGVIRRYDVGLSLASYEVDFFGRVRSLNDVALAQFLATDEARQSAQISLVSEVAKAYLAERSFAEQLALTQKTLDARVTSYDLAKKRFEVGASSALDLRQGEALLESARVTQVTLARQRAQAENALTLLTGIAVADLPAAQSLSSQKMLTEFAAGLPSDLLARRPDIRAAEQRLIAANANIGAARAAFFPRITLTAGIGTASTALSGLFEAGSRTWSFAPQLLLPIFDAGRNRANLTLTEVRKDIAVAEYEKNIQVAFREVADALVARGLLEQQIGAQQAVLQAQAERLKLSELRFQNGIASSLEVLDAQREVFSAEQSLVQARLLRLTNSIDLYRSLGGGLQAESQAAAAAPAVPRQ